VSGTGTARQEWDIEPSGDCEGRDDWWWQQDVNAWTSFAYLLPAAVALRWAMRGRAGAAFWLFAALAALEAAGSVLYHGIGGDVAQALHDLPLLGLGGFVAGWHIGRARRDADGASSAERLAVVGAVATTAVGGVAWLIAPASVSAVLGLAIVAVVTAEVTAHRRRLPMVWTGAPAALLAVAALAWVLGKDTSPWCDAASIVQWHGAWHVLSALVLAAWIERVGAAGHGRGDLRIVRPLIDASLGLLATVVVLAFHHSVSVTGRSTSSGDPLDGSRPTLIVANHANGFVDPLVVAAVLHRLPRFLAKASLWKVLPARPVLALAGVVPVHRRADGDAEGNDRSFEACHRELARGATVAIFPEGTTGDRGGLDRVRSGAARIALGAVATSPDVRIVPVGLAYESRVETRSRVAVMVGEPIDVVAEGYGSHDDERAAAAGLTERIRDALAAVSPDYRDRDHRELLRAISRVSLSTVGSRSRAPTFADVERRGRRLAQCPPTVEERLAAGFGEYAARLSVIGLSDDDLTRRRPSGSRLALTAVAVAVAGPLLATAALIHLPALLVVLAATAAVRATATKGTVRLMIGAIAGLATWIVAGVVLGDGWSVLWYAALVATGGAVALAVATPWWRATRSLFTWWRVRDRRALVDDVLVIRARLVQMVEDAVA
jgi:1-acyl-sn-glycerol-3-phosphate acyltransferase